MAQWPRCTWGIRAVSEPLLEPPGAAACPRAPAIEAGRLPLDLEEAAR